jgi:ligand-binding sensor domain-containing protein
VDGVQGFVANSDGSVWWAWIWLGFVEIGFDGSTLEVQALFLDRENVLWIGIIKQGIYRIHGRKPDHFHRAESLSSDPLYRLYEDREGTLWVATAKGFDRCSGIQ